MKKFTSPAELQAWALAQKRAGKTIGLVPTMGYLHEGHLSLIAEARKHAELVVVSIFVNPIQFGPTEDYAKYPRDEARDIRLCEGAGAAAVFLPTPENMYAKDASVTVNEDFLQKVLCGARRPVHFKGVCTVVSKLFNLAQPDIAVFGQKDFQQATIIKRMVRDLNFPVKIIVAPIVREPDGLAKSSRNVYLSPAERASALGNSRALQAAADAFAKGERDPAKLIALMSEILTNHALKIDYVEIDSAETLRPVARVAAGDVALLAVYDGKTRLIDNRIL